MTYRKIIILGAMTWLCYNGNCIVVRCVIMELNCSSLFLNYPSIIYSKDVDEYFQFR